MKKIKLTLSLLDLPKPPPLLLYSVEQILFVPILLFMVSSFVYSYWDTCKQCKVQIPHNICKCTLLFAPFTINLRLEKLKAWFDYILCMFVCKLWLFDDLRIFLSHFHISKGGRAKKSIWWEKASIQNQRHWCQTQEDLGIYIKKRNT